MARNYYENEPVRSDRSLSRLARDLLEQVSAMVRDEVRLARAEMGEKAGQASSGLTMLAIAGIIGIAALVILLMSAVVALQNVVEPWLSALIVGGVAALIALMLAASGRSNLRARNLAPTRTVQSVKDDAQLVREKVR